MPSSRGSSQLRNRTQVSHIADRFLPSETPGKCINTGVDSLSLLQGIFPIQELNQGLLHYRWVLFQLNYQGIPCAYSIQFSSVAQSCLTLCSPVDCSTPGFPVHHQLPELAQPHVHRVGGAIQPSHPVILFSTCLQSFPASGCFPMSQFFASDGQSIGASASASVLPMNIQD